MLTDGAINYIYDDNGNPIEQIDAAGAILYYQHDQYGSTRLLTNSTGAVAASYTFNANGAMTAHTGTADTPLRWNGQYQDSDTALYYLRARYYDPSTAQFLTRDPLEQLTGSAYGYGGNDPINNSDASGLCPFCVAFVVGAGIGAGMDLGFQMLNNYSNGCGLFSNIDWGQVAVSGLIGGVSGVGGEWLAGARVLQETGVAAKSVDEGVVLFRHVSPGELADIGEHGFRAGPNSLGGKWFAESGEHASQWGRVLNNGEGSVVKVRVPDSFANQLMRLEKLDGIGPARYAEPHQLDMLNRFGWELQ
jgi:RHS repeat-associated protein